MAIRGRLTVLSGRSNVPLAGAVAQYAGVQLGGCEVLKFSDGELDVSISDNVRGNDVFVIQSTSTPVNDYVMELAIIMDALKRASSQRVTAVLPYFGYARQDRKVRPRVPITAKLVADIISTAGADRVLTMDLHAGQIMGFFDLPVDNLYARPVLVKFIRDEFGDDAPICIVSPDAGGVPRARAYAKRLGVELAIIDKRRSGPNEVAEMRVVGEVKGRIAVIVDDMIDTGNTLAKAADALKDAGATRVLACATHAVLSGNAKQRMQDSSIEKVIVSDTIYQSDLDQYGDLFVRLSVAPILGEAIRRIYEEDSVSSLFDDFD